MEVVESGNMNGRMVTFNITMNYTSTSMTIQHPTDQVHVNQLYQGIAQGVFFLCLSTVVVGVMVLFICLNIIRECKVID